jgi:Flp pilus assembly protein TadD
LVAALRMVMEAVPENHHAYNALGYSLAERGVRLEEAHTLIEKALKMAPGDPYIMDSMGWVQFRMGRLKEAEQTLRQAYALRNDAEIAVHLGEVLWHAGQHAEAQKLWREARSKDPKSDALRDTLARLNTSI